MEKSKLWPQWHQNPGNFSNLNMTSVIMSMRSIPVQILISIRLAGASPQIGVKYYSFVTFSKLVGYTVFFLRHAPRSNLWMDFHSLWLIRCLFAQGWSFWGLWQYQNSFAVISQKIPQNGAWKFQAKWAKYKNRGILQSINTSNV